MAKFLFTLSDFKDSKTLSAQFNAQTQNKEINKDTPKPLRTTASADTDPQASLTTYSLSDIMQGGATYRPTSTSYDTYNQVLSRSLSEMLGGSDPQSVLGAQKQLVPDDILRTAATKSSLLADSSTLASTSGGSNPAPGSTASNDTFGKFTGTELSSYGGMFGSCCQGIKQIAAAVLAQFPGIVITSTTGGTHANGSYHYKGQAFDCDFGGNHSGDGAVFDFLLPMAQSGVLIELFFDPRGGWKAGNSVGAIGGHQDHVHVAVDDQYTSGFTISTTAGPSGGGGPARVT